MFPPILEKSGVHYPLSLRPTIGDCCASSSMVACAVYTRLMTLHFPDLPHVAVM